jgi:hypothetical protein
MWIGCARLGEEVISVVPHRDQPESAHRSERGRTGPNHNRRLSSEHRKKGAVARGGTKIGGQDDVGTGAEKCGQSSAHSCYVSSVGQAHDAAAPRSLRGGGRSGEP